jgi:hypothetical protein
LIADVRCAGPEPAGHFRYRSQENLNSIASVEDAANSAVLDQKPLTLPFAAESLLTKSQAVFRPCPNPVATGCAKKATVTI